MYVDRRLTLFYFAVLALGVVSGLQNWPVQLPGVAFIAFWILYLKHMPDEERQLQKNVRGLKFGKFIGRAFCVAVAWGLGAALRYGLKAP
jgi:hypothetical protein